MSKASVLVGACVLALGMGFLGSTLALSRPVVRPAPSDYAFLDPLIEVKSLLNRRYVDIPDDKTLQDGAIKGMLDALNDPYTVYVPKTDRREFTKQLTGEYVGIGAQVSQQDGWLTIVTPLEDSPAFKAGILPEDRVVEIEGQSTNGLTIDQCIDKLMGEPGTQVKLTIERKGQRLELTIMREKIKTRSVKGFHRSDADPNQWQFLLDPQNKIAYVRLTQFTPQCALELLNALRSVGADKGELKGLVLDLRGNGGGLLDEATAIADLFLPSGRIVSTKGRAHPEVAVEARAEGTLPDFPMVVLLNGASASASEVLAGALSENNRAVILGTRSFGKGSVQTVVPIVSSEGELKITEQGYFLPTGRSITRKDNSTAWGVDPTPGFYLPMSDEDTLELLKVRRDLELIRAGAAPADQKWSDADWVLAHLKDPQLTAAVQALRARNQTGTWQPPGQTENASTQIAVDELKRLRLDRERLARALTAIDKRTEALESAAGDAATTAKAPDLWTSTADLTGGLLEIKDKDGNVVATLRITGNDLERWLFDADVKPAQTQPAEAAPASNPPTPPAP